MDPVKRNLTFLRNQSTEVIYFIVVFQSNYSVSSNDEELSGNKEERVRKKRQLKRKRLHLANAKLNNEKREALEKGRWVQVTPTYCWEQMLSYKVQCVESPPAIKYKK